MLLFLIALGVAGCATQNSNTATAEAFSRIRTVGIVAEIKTPTTLSTRTTSGGGGVLVDILVTQPVEKSRGRTFTDQVRAGLDFQAFAAETLRESFARAVKNYPGWSLAQ